MVNIDKLSVCCLSSFLIVHVNIDLILQSFYSFYLQDLGFDDYFLGSNFVVQER